MKPKITIVVAIGKKRELGKDGKLLWHIPEDLKRFKALTMGHPIIMGRKTFESIPAKFRPLPGRTNIVVTRNPDFLPRLNLGEAEKTVVVAKSLEEALAKAKELDTEEIHIGGGAEIYKQALPFVDRLYLTLIDAEKEADTFFPPYEHLFKKVMTHSHHEHEGLKYQWIDLER